MGKPSVKACTAIVTNDPFSIRVARVGKGPLVAVWVHEDGNGGRGVVLDFDQTETLIEGLNLVLDEIDNDSEQEVE